MSLARSRFVPLMLFSLAALAGCAGGPAATGPDQAPALDRANVKPPAFNLNVELKGREATGMVRFRQPEDGATTIFLDTSIRHLQRNHDYYLQRAAQSLGLGCEDAGWLTLGEGPVVVAIHTDQSGNGNGALWRTLPASLIGQSFDIHFQVIDAVTGDVALSSRCYQYTVRGV